MNIKQKKQLNLPQLIEWGWDKDDATGVRFQSDGFVTTVYFGKNGDVSVEDCSKDAHFTVEIEEEITEDTVFENLIEIYKNPEGMKFSITHRNISINYIKNGLYLKTLAFYILNDDLTMTLIWRNGRLVE